MATTFDVLVVILVVFALAVVYLRSVNRAMDTTPPEALQISPKRWTPNDVKKAYAEFAEHPTNYSKLLPERTGRRYIVTGGSGLVGGWIVAHLLQRGESGSHIRILDVAPPTRPEVDENNVQYIKSDLSSMDSVTSAFTKPWPTSASKSPLTVIHTVAYIRASDRSPDMLAPYERVNINGTRNIISACTSSGADILVATSSGSIGIRVPRYFHLSWRGLYKNAFQLSNNGDPPQEEGLDAPLSTTGSCYAWSKMRAEKLVKDANGKNGLRTGIIRPSHAIFGDGVDSVNSISWTYLTRGGSPTWIANTINHFVNARNVSLAHLLFESKLLPSSASPHQSRSTRSSPSKPSSNPLDISGRSYAISDPNPPVTYGDFYTVLTTLAHPSTPCAFPLVPPVVMLLLAYVIEAYQTLQRKYLFRVGFKKVTGDLDVLQPAMFQMCTTNIVFDMGRAGRELGYGVGEGIGGDGGKGDGGGIGMTTLEGVCTAVRVWNEKIEAKLVMEREAGGGRNGKRNGIGEENGVLRGGVMPLVPNGEVR